jgi:uncharacterized protein (DUF433 family)
MSGAPVFAGTRVPITHLIEHLEGNYSIDGFIDNFPTVKREQVVELLHRIGELLQGTPRGSKSGNKTSEQDSIISRDPKVMGGTLVFAGKRVPVQALIDYLAAGRTIEEFRQGFPRVEQAQIVKLLHHISELVQTARI